MARLATAGLLIALVGAILPGCGAGYIVQSSYYQAELLAKRKPIDKVRRKELLDEEQLAALDVVDDVKRFGADIGLSATHNYESIALNWKRGVWVVTGCDPVSFQAETRWFPVVGRVAYLGYFTERGADRRVRRLERRGLDAYKRPAGAFSTLGWFRDPLLPAMLTWDEADLADTVLHELAHATLWVPGSVAFNESFATFVGEEAMFRYLASVHGQDSPEVGAARDRAADLVRWRTLLHALYVDLEAVYSDPDTSYDTKRASKDRLLDGLGARVDEAGFAEPERYRRAATAGTWNNARLVGFRTYHSKRELFASVLEDSDGDLLAFISAIEEIAASDRRHPFDALERAVAEP